MKIKELIEKLEEIQRTRGNLECRVFGFGDDEGSPYYVPINSVQVKNDTGKNPSFPHVQIDY